MTHEKLTFETLREANKRRLPEFKDSNGNQCHTEPDGSDWSLTDWMTAVCGETGEAANLIKKIRRGDYTIEMARHDLADEFADIVVYLDILAMQCGINLDEAVKSKFNFISTRVGSKVYIGDDNDWHLKP